MNQWRYGALGFAAITLLAFIAVVLYYYSWQGAKLLPNYPSAANVNVSEAIKPSEPTSTVQQQTNTDEPPVTTTIQKPNNSFETPLAPPPTPYTQSEINSGELVVIISENANLRYAATLESGIIREVRFGEKLQLKRRTPIGPWYKVYDKVTKSNGWLHGNTIEIE